MYSEESELEQLILLTEDWEVPAIKTELSSEIVTERFLDSDEAYDFLCELQNPKIYSFNRVNNGCEIWYKLRYKK